MLTKGKEMTGSSYEVERLQQRIHDLEQGITRVSELWAETCRERDEFRKRLKQIDDLLELWPGEVEPNFEAIRKVVDFALLK